MTRRPARWLFLAAAALLSVSARAGGLDAGPLEAALGLKLSSSPAGELKASIPQQDLAVSVDGFAITPPMGLTSWVAFAAHGDGAMAMGDLVLLEDEVGPAQTAAIHGGLSVTAIHNHFLRDRPKVMFMHVGGMGQPLRLARAVRAVLDKVKASRAARPATAATAVESSLDAEALDKAIGRSGQGAGGVRRYVLGRPDVDLRDDGAAVTAFQGFNTWMAFQGTPRRAAVSGDFAMLGPEVQPVIDALVGHGLEVTAVHNHMVGEEPRIVFLHFWGVGPQADLARGLKAALDRLGRPR